MGIKHIKRGNYFLKKLIQEILSVLSYADDCLVYEDETQIRKLYEVTLAEDWQIKGVYFNENG